MIVIIAILIFIIIGVLIFSSGILISKQKERWFILLGILMIVGAFVFPITTLLWNKAYSVKEVAALGAYGDFFGGTTVGLLSIAGASFLVASIFLQMKSNNIQKAEMVKTNEQLDLQRKEFETTNLMMAKQSFESTYFNMINLHHTILSELKIDDFQGKEAIKKIYLDFRKYIRTDGLSGYLNETVFTDSDIFYKFYINTEKIKFLSDFYRYNVEKNRMDYKSYEIFKQDVINDSAKEWDEYWYSNFGSAEDDGDFNRADEMKWIFENKNQRLKYIIENLDLTKEIPFQYIEKQLRETQQNYLNSTEIKKSVFMNFYREINLNFGHYYSNIKVIISYLNSIELEDKEVYEDIFEAQFSKYELKMAFYFAEAFEIPEMLKFTSKSSDLLNEAKNLDAWEGE